MFNGKFEFNTVVGVGVTSIEIGLEVPIQPPFSPFTVMTSPSANELDEINEDGVQRGDPVVEAPVMARLQAVTTVAAEQVFAGVAVAALAAGAPFAQGQFWVAG